MAITVPSWRKAKAASPQSRPARAARPCRTAAPAGWLFSAMRLLPGRSPKQRQQDLAAQALAEDGGALRLQMMGIRESLVGDPFAGVDHGRVELLLQFPQEVPQLSQGRGW